MHVHVLGICGTFMGGMAQLAVARGDRVTGADSGVYPPMSDQLAAAGIEVVEGWDPAQLDPAPDLVVVGNALSRGNPAVEAVLERGLRFTSGPAWLRAHVLHGRHVLAVAGTHGKTTTASMLAHVLAAAGRDPGFLIGGVPQGFGVSARPGGAGAPFVVEADEYDTAFFDKRSKFVHYGPRTLVLNNLEFDHADIFDDLGAIQRQLHHLIRTVPAGGRILTNAAAPALDAVLEMGCWTPVERFAAAAGDPAADWRALDAAAQGSAFSVRGPGGAGGRVEWPLFGDHNVANGLAAVAAAHHAGVGVAEACAALGAFAGVRRRLEVRGRARDITVHDDFAHHPTEIAAALAALRARVGTARILAVVDLASRSMRMGAHAPALAGALAPADAVFLHAGRPLEWNPMAALQAPGRRTALFTGVEPLAAALCAAARPGDHVLLMSNAGLGGLPADLVRRLADDGTEAAGGA